MLLAVASPNTSIFASLVTELVSSIYNRHHSVGLEFGEFDREGVLSYRELSDVIHEKAAEIQKDLEAAQRRAQYYEFHQRGERNVLQFAVDKRQHHALTLAFTQWRTNIIRIKKQRSKMSTIFREYANRSTREKLRKCFLLWKYQRMRTHRQVLAPQLIQLEKTAQVRR